MPTTDEIKAFIETKIAERDELQMDPHFKSSVRDVAMAAVLYASDQEKLHLPTVDWIHAEIKNSETKVGLVTGPNSVVCMSMDVGRIARGAALKVLREDAMLTYQMRVHEWMLTCFGSAITSDGTERNYRFLEEALELVQSTGCTQAEAHQLVDYVFGRPVGEPSQEVGGVMVTLAAFCSAHGLDMMSDGQTELDRIDNPETIDKIRVKQAAKPQRAPLPGASVVAADEGFAQGAACPACSGDGLVFDEIPNTYNECSDCDGSGYA